MPRDSWHLDNPLDCPLVYAVGVIGGKWKPIILHILDTGVHRFGEIKRLIPPISQKVLTQQLRDLECDRLIEREVFAEVPPRVEYRLTERGRALRPIIDGLYQWGARAKADDGAGAGAGAGVVTGAVQAASPPEPQPAGQSVA